ncbi:uncharacterized protein LOC128387206 [Panonychus citri]|uniref:uncharacterized protein LOC128387206 n=1 Tax=Panonychus citri TaxID=50023 RepID=UPI002307F9D5|nr:uncharacterized protein LOC128387206 [Panonychus citri]
MSKLSILLVLCCLSLQVFAYDHGHGHGGGGASKVFQKQDGKGNYAFGYNVLDPKGASNYREESGDAWGNKAGSYGLKDKDGRLRIVHYVADKNGFRVKIDSNEPGVASVDSAHAKFNGPDHHGSKVAHISHQKPYVHHEPRYDEHRSVVPSVPVVPSLPSIPHVEKPSYPMEKKSDEFDVDIPALGDILN